MDTLIQILAGFGLAAPAGLNAWLPLLIVGLAGRFTDLIHLNAPYNLLEEPVVLIIIALLLGIEVFADKIPVVDSVNDIIHTFIRPTAGAILFAANANAVSDMSPVLALILGLLAAGGVHAIKASVRPVITASTAGIANPFVSIVEDVVAAITVIVALLAPIVALIILIVALVVVFQLVDRWRSRRAAPAAPTK